ncbi:IS66 family insertion sequence element accessory protein TnpB [Candidatus Pacearchaeota archaeon]|nr:IS66 family insertion sequence element accessory protein TnpB [Candidatus Pacearchaeota archaeon]
MADKVPSGLRQKRKFWAAHVKAWKESGLSQAEYCRRQDLDSTRLSYWANKSNVKPAAMTLVEVPRPVDVGTGLKLYAGHYQLEIGNQFAPAALEQVLKVLERL